MVILSLIYNNGMSCNNCNRCGDDPCSCGGCNPARYSCDFSIQVDPFNPYVWLFDSCGKISRVDIPKIPETCTSLSTNFSAASLVYNSECGQDIITGHQLGQLINLDDLRDVDAADADSCDLLVFDPGCAECGDGCKPKPAMWRKYHIPDAGDCEVEPDDDGYYHVLIKDDCGCIKECRLPVVPHASAVINYIRDSVPDDPDYPWYYGCYNDKINLHLRQNVPQWFGKYDLEITVNYGIQAVKSTASKSVNFRSLMVPVVEGTSINVTRMSSILQDDTVYSASDPEIPWASKSMRGSITFIVPKGKEAYLHHEYRLRTVDSHAAYYFNATYDGKKVPDDIAGQIDRMPYNASRLNALQIIAKPARGISNFEPVVDSIRSQLDDHIDEYPNIG